jgi:5-oxoprolinase (ATP-hydrolysing)
MESLATQARSTLSEDESSHQEEVIRKVNLKYDGTNSTLSVDFNSDWAMMQQEFEVEHKSRYGFIQSQKSLIVESASEANFQYL